MPDALDATLQHVSYLLPDVLDATLQHVSCLLPDALDATLQHVPCLLPDVLDATAAACPLSLARRSWCYAATCLLSLARRKCFQVNHVKMEFTRKTRKRGHKTHGTQCIDKKWSALKRYIQRNCVLRRPMDCWMKKLPSMCTVLSGDPIHLESTSSKA